MGVFGTLSTDKQKEKEKLAVTLALCQCAPQLQTRGRTLLLLSHADLGELVKNIQLRLHEVSDQRL